MPQQETSVGEHLQDVLDLHLLAHDPERPEPQRRRAREARNAGLAVALEHLGTRPGVNVPTTRFLHSILADDARAEFRSQVPASPVPAAVELIGESDPASRSPREEAAERLGITMDELRAKESELDTLAESGFGFLVSEGRRAIVPESTGFLGLGGGDEVAIGSDAFDAALFVDDPLLGHRNEILRGDVQEDEDGRRYVAVSEENVWASEGEKRVYLEEFDEEARKEITNALSGYAFDGTLLGYLPKLLSPEKEGLDRNVETAIGLLPRAPQVTGDFDDIARLKDPIYLRSLIEAEPAGEFFDAFKRQGAGIADFILVMAGTNALTGGAGSLARQGLTRAAARGGSATRFLAGPARSGLKVLGSGRKAGFRTPGLNFDVRQIWGEVYYHALRNSITGQGTFLEGVSEGATEGVLEAIFGHGGRAIRRVAGHGARKLRARRLADILQGTSDPAGRVRSMLGTRLRNAGEVEKAYREAIGSSVTDQAAGQALDSMVVAYGLGSYTDAIKSAGEDGKNWDRLSSEEKLGYFARELGSGLSPEKLGMAAAFGVATVGHRIGHGVRVGARGQSPEVEEQIRRLKTVADDLLSGLTRTEAGELMHALERDFRANERLEVELRSALGDSIAAGDPIRQEDLSVEGLVQLQRGEEERVKRGSPEGPSIVREVSQLLSPESITRLLDEIAGLAPEQKVAAAEVRRLLLAEQELRAADPAREQRAADLAEIRREDRLAQRRGWPYSGWQSDGPNRWVPKPLEGVRGQPLWAVVRLADRPEGEQYAVVTRKRGRPAGHRAGPFPRFSDALVAAELNRRDQAARRAEKEQTTRARDILEQVERRAERRAQEGRELSPDELATEVRTIAEAIELGTADKAEFAEREVRAAQREVLGAPTFELEEGDPVSVVVGREPVEGLVTGIVGGRPRVQLPDGSELTFTPEEVFAPGQAIVRPTPEETQAARTAILHAARTLPEFAGQEDAEILGAILQPGDTGSRDRLAERVFLVEQRARAEPQPDLALAEPLDEPATTDQDLELAVEASDSDGAPGVEEAVRAARGELEAEGEGGTSEEAAAAERARARGRSGFYTGAAASRAFSVGQDAFRRSARHRNTVRAMAEAFEATAEADPSLPNDRRDALLRGAILAVGANRSMLRLLSALTGDSSPSHVERVLREMATRGRGSLSEALERLQRVQEELRAQGGPTLLSDRQLRQERTRELLALLSLDPPVQVTERSTTSPPNRTLVRDLEHWSRAPAADVAAEFDVAFERIEAFQGFLADVAGGLGGLLDSIKGTKPADTQGLLAQRIAQATHRSHKATERVVPALGLTPNQLARQIHGVLSGSVVAIRPTASVSGVPFSQLGAEGMAEGEALVAGRRVPSEVADFARSVGHVRNADDILRRLRVEVPGEGWRSYVPLDAQPEDALLSDLRRRVLARDPAVRRLFERSLELDGNPTFGASAGQVFDLAREHLARAVAWSREVGLGLAEGRGERRATQDVMEALRTLERGEEVPPELQRALVRAGRAEFLEGPRGEKLFHFDKAQAVNRLSIEFLADLRQAFRDSALDPDEMPEGFVPLFAGGPLNAFLGFDPISLEVDSKLERGLDWLFRKLTPREWFDIAEQRGWDNAALTAFGHLTARWWNSPGIPTPLGFLGPRGGRSVLVDSTTGKAQSDFRFSAFDPAAAKREDFLMQNAGVLMHLGSWITDPRLASLVPVLMEEGAYRRMRGPRDLRRFLEKRGEPISEASADSLFEAMLEMTAIAGQMGAEAQRAGILSQEQLEALRDRYVMRWNVKDGDWLKSLLGKDKAFGPLSRSFSRTMESDYTRAQRVLDPNVLFTAQVGSEASTIQFFQTLHKMTLGHGWIDGERFATMPGWQRTRWVRPAIAPDAFETSPHVRRQARVQQAKLGAWVDERRRRMEAGDEPWTEQKEALLDRLETGYVPLQTLGWIDVLLDAQDPSKLAPSIGGLIQDLVLGWRRLRTASTPKHWVMNIGTSILTNWVMGKVGPRDFMLGITRGKGAYADAARMLDVWWRWMQEGRQSLEGRSPQEREAIRQVEDFASVAGRSTFVSSQLRSMQAREMFSSMLRPGGRLQSRGESERIIEGAAQFVGGMSQSQAGLEQRILSWLGSPNPTEQVEAMHLHVAQYQLIEMWFKLAGALGVSRRATGGMEWKAAVADALEGTGDYGDVSPSLYRFTTQFDFGRVGERERAARGIAGASGFAPGLSRVARAMMAQPFLLYPTTMTLPLARAAFTRPFNAAAASAVAVTMATVMSQLSGGEDDEAVDALVGTPEFQHEEFRDVVPSDDAIDSFIDRVGGIPPFNLGGSDGTGDFGQTLKDSAFARRAANMFRDLVHASKRAAVARAPDRAGRSRVSDVTDFLRPASIPIDAKARWDLVASHQSPRFHSNRFLEMFGFFVPGMMIDTLRQISGGLRGKKGTAERVTIGAEAFLNEWTGAISPTWLLSRESRRILGEEIILDGQRIRDVAAGIERPGARRTDLGDRLGAAAFDIFFRAQEVPARSVERVERTGAASAIRRELGGFDRGEFETRIHREIGQSGTLALRQVSEIVRDLYEDYRTNPLLHGTQAPDGTLSTFGAMVMRELRITDDLDENGNLVAEPERAIGRFVQRNPKALQTVLDMWESDRLRTGIGLIAQLGDRQFVDGALVQRLWDGLIRGAEGDLLEDQARFIWRNVVEAPDDDNLGAYEYLYSRYVQPVASENRVVEEMRREIDEVFSDLDGQHPAADYRPPVRRSTTGARSVAEIAGGEAVDVFPREFIFGLEERAPTPEERRMAEFLERLEAPVGQGENR